MKFTCNPSKTVFDYFTEKLCPIDGKVKFNKMKSYCNSHAGILSEKITMHCLCNVFICVYLGLSSNLFSSTVHRAEAPEL